VRVWREAAAGGRQSAQRRQGHGCHPAGAGGRGRGRQLARRRRDGGRQLARTAWVPSAVRQALDAGRGEGAIRQALDAGGGGVGGGRATEGSA